MQNCTLAVVRQFWQADSTLQGLQLDNLDAAHPPVLFLGRAVITTVLLPLFLCLFVFLPELVAAPEDTMTVPAAAVTNFGWQNALCRVCSWTVQI